MNFTLIKKLSTFYFLIIWVTNAVNCFSPLTDKVDSDDAKTFVISSYEDDYNNEDNELIQPEDIEHIKFLASDEENTEPNNLKENSSFKRTLESNPTFKWRKINNLKCKDEDNEYKKNQEIYLTRDKRNNEVFSNISERKQEDKKNFLNDLSTTEVISTEINDYKYKKKSPEIHNQYTEKTTLVTDKQTTKILTKTEFTVPVQRMTIKESTKRSRPTNLIKENETMNTIDHEKIMPEYSLETEDIQSDNFTYNFTQDEIERSLQKIISKAFNFKKPRNCSQAEDLKFGIEAIKCVVSDFQRARNRTEAKKIFLRSWKILRIWLYIYICIVITCWCHKGWCCCCFRCKICFPNKIITKEKKYFSENPPGILVNITTEKQKLSTPPITYEPTIFEKDAYEKFERVMSNL